jgi:hypothetical protein
MQNIEVKEILPADSRPSMNVLRAETLQLQPKRTNCLHFISSWRKYRVVKCYDTERQRHSKLLKFKKQFLMENCFS